MTQKLQAVRGTKDYIGEEAEKFRFIVNAAQNAGKLYGFSEVITPIIESTEVFKRTLGETSDVVNKEMYIFDDKGGDSITLRPEFTAGIARAFISNGWQQNLPLKLFSYGPLFRYERPQKGRQRQFHQINFEWLGEKSPFADVEMIVLANNILQELGVKNFKLNINTLGDAETRTKYREALVEYFSKYKNELSEESKIRLEKNPMRILDSKDEKDIKISQSAPHIIDFFTVGAVGFYSDLKEGLNKNKIDFIENPKIVRGLDYYNHTVFEFISDAEEIGAQNTILAGGRYDNLIKNMGGAEVPAVGFAAGIERLMLVAEYKPETQNKIAILTVNEYVNLAISIAEKLRKRKIPAEIIADNKDERAFKKAEKAGATQVILLYSTDANANKITIKNLQSSTRKEISLTEIDNHEF